MPDLKNITVNGIPLEKVIKEEVVAEMKSNHQETVAKMSFIARRSRSYSTRLRGGSGARSGRGRIIFSAAMGGAQ